MVVSISKTESREDYLTSHEDFNGMMHECW